MGKLFDLDSPVMRFLSRVADLMILNILVLVTSIPVITIGASFTAMHYVLIKMVRNEETYIVKMYFKSFKENFVQSTIEWIIIMLIGGVFAGDYFVFVRSGHEFSTVFMISVLTVFVLFLMSVMYVFPLQARFYNKISKTLKNAFLIMILNFPKSILMIVMYALPVVLFFISDFAVPFLIMFGVSVPGLGAVYLYRKVFERFEPAAAQITDDMDFHVEMPEGYDEATGMIMQTEGEAESGDAFDGDDAKEADGSVSNFVEDADSSADGTAESVENADSSDM